MLRLTIFYFFFEAAKNIKKSIRGTQNHIQKNKEPQRIQDRPQPTYQQNLNGSDFPQIMTLLGTVIQIGAFHLLLVWHVDVSTCCCTCLCFLLQFFWHICCEGDFICCGQLSYMIGHLESRVHTDVFVYGFLLSQASKKLPQTYSWSEVPILWLALHM